MGAHKGEGIRARAPPMRNAGYGGGSGPEDPPPSFVALFVLLWALRSHRGPYCVLPGLVRALRHSTKSLRFAGGTLSVEAIPGLVRVLPSLVTSVIATKLCLGGSGRR